MNGMRRNLSIALSFQLSDNFVEALLIVFTVPLLPSSLETCAAGPGVSALRHPLTTGPSISCRVDVERLVRSLTSP